jgi:pyruvate dehydrogenase E2 component (dihydrolipoamide acetyltransferase)
MPISITVPRLGWSMDEGTFTGWLKKNGEAVNAGEPLFTLEGDKTSQEVEATDSGILRIPPDAPHAGDPVLVGAVLGYLVGKEETVQPTPEMPPPSAAAEKPAEVVPSAEAATTAALTRRHEPAGAERTAAGITISPRARRCAAELGLDWSRLRGSGRSGRITEDDVLKAAKGPSAPGSSAMRRTIAQRTAESFSRAPHFYLRTEVDAGALLELRAGLLAEIERTAGVRLTLTDLLLRAQALALRACPFANAIWQDGQVVPLPGCDIGLVVGLEDGLLIPIVRAADAGGLGELARQRASLVDAARAQKLAAEAMRGGATSLSNLGNTCVDEFAAVISPPQSSMLAVGRAAPRPWVVSGQVVVRTTLKLCLSVDHRVMDGATAARFLGRIVEFMEHPAKLPRW